MVWWCGGIGMDGMEGERGGKEEVRNEKAVLAAATLRTEATFVSTHNYASHSSPSYVAASHLSCGGLAGVDVSHDSDVAVLVEADSAADAHVGGGGVQGGGGTDRAKEGGAEA